MRMTDTELKLMAAAAMMGLSSKSEERIKDAGGDRHAERVVDEGEEQILADVAHGGLAQFTCAHDPAKVSFDQRDAAALDRDVRAGAHGDADMGLRQGGRVVDAVAGHRDDLPCCWRRLMISAFFAEGLPLRIRRAERCCDGRGGGLVVARHHDEADPLRFQFAQRIGSGPLDGIGNDEVSLRAPVDGDVDDRAAVDGRSAQVRRAMMPRLAQERRLPTRTSLPFHFPFTPRPVRY